MNTPPTPPSEVTRVMVDLETFGTRPGSVIASIGAVIFGGGQILKEFYVKVCVQSCLDAGMTMNWNTITWWLGQSEEARLEMTNKEGRLPISKALGEFTCFLYDDQPKDASVEMWGNGAAFDNALLAEAYRLTNLTPPWKFWNDRCYRTIKALHPDIQMERTGTHHNALDDAKSQAIHLMKMLPTL